MEVQLRDKQFGIFFDRQSISIVEMTPKLSHFYDHRFVSHRVLNDKRMAFSQDFMQDMTELPCCDSVFLQRLTNGNRPKRMTTCGIRIENFQVLMLHWKFFNRYFRPANR